MRILALDLGTSTGWAIGGTESKQAGAWELATPRNLQHAKKLRMDRRLDIRAAALWNHLCSVGNFDWLFFEDVRFASSQAQGHLWGTLRGVIWAFAHSRGVQVECLDTGKLKKFASGSGSADKDQMAKSLVRKDPKTYSLEKQLVRATFSTTLLNDDAVDALHLLYWAEHLLLK